MIGQPVNNSDDVAINFSGQPVFAGSSVICFSARGATSYQIQRLRDNVDCADQEFDGPLEEDNPGLSVKPLALMSTNIAARRAYPPRAFVHRSLIA